MIPRNRPELSTTTALPPLLPSAIICLISRIGADGHTRVTLHERQGEWHHTTVQHST